LRIAGNFYKKVKWRGLIFGICNFLFGILIFNMEHANVATEVTIHHEPSGSTKRIWKVFWILLIITMVKLGIGLSL